MITDKRTINLKKAKLASFERSGQVGDGDLYITDKRVILKRGLNIIEA